MEYGKKSGLPPLKEGIEYRQGIILASLKGRMKEYDKE